jgi:signal transduction histidine kinase
MKISGIILLSVIVITLFFSGAIYISYREAKVSISEITRFGRSSTVSRQSDRFQRNFLSMVSNLRGFLLTGEMSFIRAYDSTRRENDEILAELNAFFVEGSDQRIVIDDIREIQRYWFDEFAAPLRNAKMDAMNSHITEREFQKLYGEKLNSKLEPEVQQSLRRKFSELAEPADKLLGHTGDALVMSLTQISHLTIYSGIIIVLFGIGSIFLVRFYVKQKVGNLTTGIDDLTIGNYDVRFNEAKRDELSDLRLSLNNMASGIREHFDQLKRQKESMENFAYIISHDLRGPLRGIDNVVSWMTNEKSPGACGENHIYLEMVKAKVRRAENILNAIFVYTCAGREALIKEAVNVNELLEEIRQDIVYESTITLQIESNLPDLYTEKAPLDQVFTNLIANAFIHHHRTDGNVKVYHKKENDFFRFFVEDDGPGIEPRFHRKIFQAFETLSRNDGSSHVGIGLTIVKKILDDRNLELQFTSEPGAGTIFTFTWPRIEL